MLNFTTRLRQGPELRFCYGQRNENSLLIVPARQAFLLKPNPARPLLLIKLFPAKSESKTILSLEIFERKNINQQYILTPLIFLYTRFAALNSKFVCLVKILLEIPANVGISGLWPSAKCKKGQPTNHIFENSIIERTFFRETFSHYGRLLPSVSRTISYLLAQT